jgi:hypothetical protein
MSRTRSVALAALTLLVLSAGCAGLFGGESEQARQLQQASLDAMGSVDTYEFEMTMTASAEEQSVEVEATGVANRSGPRSTLTVTVDTPRGDQRVTAYLVGGTAYAEAGGRWQTREVDLAEQRDRLQQMEEILNASTVTFEGNSTLDGEPVSTLRLEVPQDRLDELSVLSQGGGAGVADFDFTEFTYTLQVSRDDHLPRQVEIDATAQAGGRSIDLTGTVRYSEFGRPQNITLPGDAPA